MSWIHEAERAHTYAHTYAHTRAVHSKASGTPTLPGWKQLQKLVNFTAYLGTGTSCVDSLSTMIQVRLCKLPWAIY